jgi:hypothetical protein
MADKGGLYSYRRKCHQKADSRHDVLFTGFNGILTERLGKSHSFGTQKLELCVLRLRDLPGSLQNLDCHRVRRPRSDLSFFVGFVTTVILCGVSPAVPTTLGIEGLRPNFFVYLTFFGIMVMIYQGLVFLFLWLLQTTWGWCSPQAYPQHYQLGYRYHTFVAPRTVKKNCNNPNEIISVDTDRIVARSGIVATATGMILLALAISTIYPWPAHAELSLHDLDTVNEIVKESERHTRTTMDLKFRNVDRDFYRMDLYALYPYNLYALISVSLRPLESRTTRKLDKSWNNTVIFLNLLQLVFCLVLF